MRVLSATFPSPPAADHAWRAEGISVVVGAVISVGLFVGLAYIGHDAKPAPVTVIADDLHQVFVPPEPPPPPVVVQAEPQPVETSVIGIDVAATESPVHIAVSLPPLLDTMPPPVAPPARIQSSPFHAEFKPKLSSAVDLKKVYQMTEVDEKPSVLVETSPMIPRLVRDNAETLRVVLLMVVDVNGEATNLRVLESSGNPAFDRIIMDCVQHEWQFRPAVKHGHRVKCLVQRSIRIRWSTSKFEI